MAAELDKESLFNDSFWAYIAGLFDGEGTIWLRKPDKWYGGFSLNVSISNTDDRLMVWLKNSLRGGVTVYIRPNPKYKPNYRWFACGKDAEYVLQHIIPYLIIKKEQALLALEFRKTVRKIGKGQTVKLSRQTINYRMNIAEKMALLNKKGVKSWQQKR